MTLPRWDFFNACRAAFFLSAALWVVSLCCPVYVTDMDVGPIYDRGWEVLLFGWAGVFASLDYALELGRYEADFIGGFAWLANVLLLLNLRRMWQGRAPNAVAAWLALPLAALGLHILYPGLFDRDFGVVGATKPVYGAYIWAASMLPPLPILLVGWLRRFTVRIHG
jgi:hypothetical protein